MGKRINRPLLVFVSYALLTVIMTWPLAGRIGTHIPGSEGDAWVHQWTFHYVLETLRNGGALFHTNLMYYPEGVSLLYHNFAWLHIGLWLPLQAVVGEAAAYTLIFMGGFAFTGLTTYLLAREVLADEAAASSEAVASSEAAAYVAGLIAAFWPYTLSHHNHPNLIFIGFVPLVMLWSKRVIEAERDRWWQVVVLGVMIALLGITRWQLLVIAGWLIFLYLLWLLWQQRAGFGRSVVRLTAAGLIGFVLMLPLLWPVLSSQVAADAEALSAGEQRSGQTDLLAYLTPSRYHPLWGEAAFTLTKNYTVDQVFTPFLGFTTLFLALYGVFKRWRGAWFWLLAAVVYIILALGGLLQINGEHYFALPYRALEHTLMGEIVRRPSRFNVILSIPMALLAGYGVMAIRERVSRSKFYGSGWVMVGVVLLILGEYVVVYPTYALDTPSWYEELAEKEMQFGILDLPIHRRVYDEQYMYYQFTHGKSLVGGHVSRPPEETFMTINEIRFLRDFRADKRPLDEITAVGEELRRLANNNVSYLILHKQFMAADTINLWKQWLVITPAYEDDQLVVYHTDPQPERDYLWKDIFLPEVGVIEYQISPQETAQDGWVMVDVVWASNTVLPETVIANVQAGHDVQVCLYLLDQANRKQETMCKIPIVPFEAWRPGEILRDRFVFHMSPYLQAGTYAVSADMRYVDTGEQIGEAVGLGEVIFTAVPRSFERPEPAKATNFTWVDEAIDLVGYDLVQNEAQLELTLHWLANERPTHSNVVFVHLIDADTNTIVKQHDAAPRNWGYPMNWWEAGEYVMDTIVLSLDAAPTGRYRLMVGMYDVETQERAAVWRDGRLIEGGSAMLETITTQ